MQNYDVFMTKGLETLYMSYIKDRAAAVRELGIERIPQLLKTFGNNWVGVFVSKLGDLLGKDSTYTTKITVLYSLQVLLRRCRWSPCRLEESPQSRR